MLGGQGYQGWEWWAMLNMAVPLDASLATTTLGSRAVIPGFSLNCVFLQKKKNAQETFDVLMK